MNYGRDVEMDRKKLMKNLEEGEKCSNFAVLFREVSLRSL